MDITSFVWICVSITVVVVTNQRAKSHVALFVFALDMAKKEMYGRMDEDELLEAFRTRWLRWRSLGMLPEPQLNVPYSIWLKWPKRFSSSAPQTREELQELMTQQPLVWACLCGGLTPSMSACPDAILPPSTIDLLKAFQEPIDGASMTVGARAFAKHHHRNTSFWGNADGSPTQISQHALHKCMDILTHAKWKYVFFQPPKPFVCMYEVRMDNGYGARWELDHETIRFRGFVEPVDVNGTILITRQN